MTQDLIQQGESLIEYVNLSCNNRQQGNLIYIAHAQCLMDLVTSALFVTVLYSPLREFNNSDNDDETADGMKEIIWVVKDLYAWSNMANSVIGLIR